jgi:Bacterial extracellular solute-binding protein
VKRQKRQSALRVAATSAAAVVAMGALGACGSGTGSPGADGASKTLRVTLANHVWTDAVKSRLPEFEKATGLKVELSQYGEDQLSDQYNVKLNAGTSEIDVMMYRPLQEGKLFAKNGYLADLSTKVKTNKEWGWEDFQPGPVGATTYKDKVVGVPIITEQEVLYYRKDLLSKAGLQVPKTMDELQAAAKAIKAQNPGVAGFVARTGKSAAVTQFSSFLYSFGGDFIDASGKSAVSSDAAKKAYAFYCGLIHNYGPANVSTDMSWPEAMAIFTQQGRALHRGRQPVQERHRPGQVKGLGQSRVRADAGRLQRLQGLQHPVVGAGGQRSIRKPGERLEVHRVGDQQEHDAADPDGRRPRCPSLCLERPGRGGNLPGRSCGSDRRQHQERCRARPAPRDQGAGVTRHRGEPDRHRDHRRRLGRRR